MIGKPYFVILNHPNGSVIPLEDGDGNLAMYESELLATAGGESSSLGSEYGFEIFELGGGI